MRFQPEKEKGSGTFSGTFSPTDSGSKPGLLFIRSVKLFSQSFFGSDSHLFNLHRMPYWGLYCRFASCSLQLHGEKFWFCDKAPRNTAKESCIAVSFTRASTYACRSSNMTRIGARNRPINIEGLFLAKGGRESGIVGVQRGV